MYIGYCLLIVLTASLGSTNSVLHFIPPVLDFSPFHDGIRKALATSKDLIKPMVNYYSINASNSNNCHMPTSSVMFSYGNHHVMDLIVLQHKAMEAHNLRACLESRFVTVCFDSKCMSVCDESKIPNCVLIKTPDIPASDFGKGFYNWFTYIKHELMYEALKVVEEVFFFDADVVLFRNPWHETTYGRHENGSHIIQPYDIMWQRDRGRGPSCSGTVNSGQMYVRNSTKAQDYFQAMFGVRDVILQGGRGLDQDFVGNATRIGNLTSCSFSGALFTTHCLVVFGNLRYIDSHTKLSDMISYHTACVEGVAQKKAHLLKMISGVNAKNTKNEIGNYVRQRRRQLFV